MDRKKKKMEKNKTRPSPSFFFFFISLFFSHPDRETCAPFPSALSGTLLHSTLPVDSSHSASVSSVRLFFFFRFFFSCEVFIATPQNCVWRTSFKNNRLREREREKNFDFSSRKRGTLAFFLPFFFFSNLRFFGTSRSSTVSFFFFKWKAKPYGWWNKKKTEAIAWRE